MRPIQKNVFYLNCTEILEAGMIRKDFKQRYCSWWLRNKESTHNIGDVGSVPGFGKSPGERNCSPLQYSCWEIPWAFEPGGPQSMGSHKSQI